jgi:hypothetical protein
VTDAGQTGPPGRPPVPRGRRRPGQPGPAPLLAWPPRKGGDVLQGRAPRRPRRCATACASTPFGVGSTPGYQSGPGALPSFRVIAARQVPSPTPGRTNQTEQSANATWAPLASVWTPVETPRPTAAAARRGRRAGQPQPLVLFEGHPLANKNLVERGGRVGPEIPHSGSGVDRRHAGEQGEVGGLSQGSFCRNCRERSSGPR